MVFPLPLNPFNNTRCKDYEIMATKSVVEWYWGRKNENKWIKLSRDNSNALEKEFKASNNGTRTKRKIYTCFGSLTRKASVSFSKMETFCAGTCCVEICGEKAFENHMVYKLKRKEIKTTDIDSAFRELKKPVVKKNPVWYWVPNTKSAKPVRVPAKENKEIEEEYKVGTKKGYQCFGDGRALAYIDFKSMKTQCNAILCKKCEIGRCINNMAFKIERRLE